MWTLNGKDKFENLRVHTCVPANRICIRQIHIDMQVVDET